MGQDAGYTPTAEETANLAKNTYNDADGNPVAYTCYSDVVVAASETSEGDDATKAFATRVVLSAGAFLVAAATAMV